MHAHPGVRNGRLSLVRTRKTLGARETARRMREDPRDDLVQRTRTSFLPWCNWIARRRHPRWSWIGYGKHITFWHYPRSG